MACREEGRREEKENTTGWYLLQLLQERSNNMRIIQYNNTIVYLYWSGRGEERRGEGTFCNTKLSSPTQTWGATSSGGACAVEEEEEEEEVASTGGKLSVNVGISPPPALTVILVMVMVVTILVYHGSDQDERC